MISTDVNGYESIHLEGEYPTHRINQQHDTDTLSVVTVCNYLSLLFEKLNVLDRSQAALLTLR